MPSMKASLRIAIAGFALALRARGRQSRRGVHRPVRRRGAGARGAAQSLVPPPGQAVGRGAGRRQRPARRDGLRRHRQRAPPAQRRHALGRRAVRSEQSRGAGGPAGGATADLRGQIRRSRPAHRRKDDGQAAGADAVSAGRRSAADVPGSENRRRLPPRPEPRHRRRQRHLHCRRREVHARGLRQPGGPGDRRAPCGRQAGADRLHRRHDQSAEGHRGEPRHRTRW